MATNFIRSSLFKLRDNLILTYRTLKFLPREYDRDPAPLFFHPETQSLLRILTRVDLAKVYRVKQTGKKELEKPVYKFMTNEELEECLNEAKKKVDSLIQIPPVVKVREDQDIVLDREPALEGLDECKHIFVDISFGVKDHERLVVVREADGTLRNADWEIRDRMNQLYFPKKGRQHIMPKMFEDEHLENLLNQKEYEFMLNRACTQFEPDDAMYHKITSVTYQYINESNNFALLRSTRHFGALAFFLVWYKEIDNLLLELLEGNHAEEVFALLKLFEKIHQVGLPIDECVKSVAAYIDKFSVKKSALELTLQAHNEHKATAAQ